MSFHLKTKYKAYIAKKHFVLLFSLFFTAPLCAESLVDQWKQGLTRAKLTAYNGSLISSNSTLAIINFCPKGRYSFYKEGGWYVEGQAAGASQQTITGYWDIKSTAGSVELSYQTDQGLTGSFPIYLQINGRVNIAGVSYAAQKNAADCRLQ